MDQLIEFASKHALLAGGFVVVLGLLVWTELSGRIRGLKELTPAQAVPWINDPDTVIVDISSVADFNKGHIVDARNIQPSRLSDSDPEVNKLQGKKVLVVCRSGTTAVPAASSLAKLGAAEVAILKGGMAQWQSDNYPITKK